MKFIIKTYWPVLLFAGLCLFQFKGVIGGLFVSPDFILNYPQTQWAFSGIKTWNPYIYNGVSILPHVFNPFYLVGMYGINLMVLHIFIACVGMWVYLKKGFGGIFGGIAYGFTGLMVSLIYAGHEGKIMVMAYFPIMLWMIDGLTNWKRAVGLGVMGWLCLSTGHVQMSYYLFVFCAVYFICKKELWGKWKLVLMAVALAVILFLPQYFITNNIVRASTRGENKTYQRATSYSMPPEELISTVDASYKGEMDQYHGRKELKQHTEFMGAIVIVLMIWSFFIKRRWEFLAIAVVSLILSFGKYTPLYNLIYLIPPNSIFRSPSMAFFGFVFSGIVGASILIERAKWGAVLLGLILWVDLWGVTGRYVKPTTFEREYGNVRDVAEWIQKDKTDFRIATPDAEIADNRFMLWGIKSINGHYAFPRKEFVDSVGGNILPDYSKVTVKLLREMNVKYIVTKQEAAWEKVFTGKYYYVYKTP